MTDLTGRRFKARSEWKFRNILFPQYTIFTVQGQNLGVVKVEARYKIPGFLFVNISTYVLPLIPFLQHTREIDEEEEVNK